MLADIIGSSMPEGYPDEHLRRSYCLLRGPHEGSLQEYLKLVIYRTSNNLSNLFCKEKWEATIAIFEECGFLDLKLDLRNT